MSNMTIEKKIQLTEQALNMARDDRNKAEAQKTVHESDLEAQYTKSRELGVEPEQLETKINEIRTEIGTIFGEMQGLGLQEYFAKVGL